MNLTCLSIYPPISPVPKFANDSNIFVHQTYNPASGGLAQLISASLARSTFSINDVRYLIDRVFDENGKSWSSSEVVKIKPVPSIIIYSSIALALFIILSIIFCVASCRCSNKYQKKRRQMSKRTGLCIFLLIVVYLLGIGDTIYVAYRINKSKVAIDNTVKTINEDIYPRAVAEHVEYLAKQLNHLDRYTINDNSILINASKSMLVQAFDRILTEKYFLRDIAQTINTTDEHFRQLNVEVNNQSASLSPFAIELFNELDERYQLLHVYIQAPIEEVCKYSSGTHTDIDQQLLDALDVVHVELKHVNQTLREDILSKITPWDKNMLIDMKLEEDIRKYINIGGSILLLLVILLGAIPLVFLCLILICRMCGCCQTELDDNQIPMANVMTISVEDDSDNNRHRQYKIRNSVAPTDHRRRLNRSKKKNSSRAVFCLIRTAFFIMMIFLVLMVLITIVSYTLDLIIQGTCRSVHDDQSYLINVLTEQLIKSNVIFGNTTEMNKTISNIINDCGSQTHFSRKFLDSFWSTLANNVKLMMNILSEQIYDSFIQSIEDINIAEDRKILHAFRDAINISNIQRIIDNIQTDFTNLEELFANINSSNSTLPSQLVQPTIDQFQAYMKNVLESTIDACPLPLPTVSEMDTLICHTLGGSIDGLWLSMFIFMILITLGCCIFGICVYNRINRPLDLVSSISTAYF